MVAFISLVVSAILCMFSQTAEATPGPDFASLIPRLLPQQLAARQDTVNVPDIPEQCRSACSGLENLETTCASNSDPAKCLCNDSVSDAFGSCLNCALEQNKSDSAKSLAQTTFDKYADLCKEADSPVKSQKLTGSSNSAMGVVPGVLGVASLAASALAIML
ncbi:hypothetical protein PLEOSDRAFT_1107420 [Pleurotus ostreatus PC15]|uniref:Extracellular membrane protein CFEM domain-containing protein n=1 Tax=Pleurotus ostreatus (strain PC15) TaxID=1137138 RepID=A0A067NLL0_PLEO1|nr:hypothetical protein PLEOSDRAFT_1107420 [Pleurotus ostreatus PC15]